MKRRKKKLTLNWLKTSPKNAGLVQENNSFFDLNFQKHKRKNAYIFTIFSPMTYVMQWCLLPWYMFIEDATKILVYNQVLHFSLVSSSKKIWTLYFIKKCLVNFTGLWLHAAYFLLFWKICPFCKTSRKGRSYFEF